MPDVATYESGDKASIDYNKYICQYDVDSPQDTLDGNPSSLVGRDKCASYYLDSFSLFGYCVPSILEDFAEEAQNLVISQYQYFKSILKRKQKILNISSKLLKIQNQNELRLTDHSPRLSFWKISAA